MVVVESYRICFDPSTNENPIKIQARGQDIGRDFWMKKIRYRFKRETLVRKKVDLIKILWFVLELVVRTGENGLSIPIVEYGGRAIYELRVNDVVSSLSLP